jgi:hypothetical protein
MNVELIKEPHLEFGDSHQHIDIRAGITCFGPLDVNERKAPKNIKIGIVGTSETNEKLALWLEKCKNTIDGKNSKQHNLFPAFPGFNYENSFRSELIIDSSLIKSISVREMEKIVNIPKRSELISEAISLIYSEIKKVADKEVSDTILCAIPANLYEKVINNTSFDSDKRDVLEGENDPILDFHDKLKAVAMSIRRPIQIILPSTFGLSLKKRIKKRKQIRPLSLQDEATRAWNLHTALYYKAAGIPWRVPHVKEQLTACYVGISFYNSIDKTIVLSSIAQVFDERGLGTILRGGKAQIDKNDRRPYLNAEDTYLLICMALKDYKDEHLNLPARVVIHKSSHFANSEIDGIKRAIQQYGISRYDLVAIKQTGSRLFRDGSYPPLRGTILIIDSKRCILYSRGSVDFYETYPGMYVPRPIEINSYESDETPKFLATEVLALTKMNWNNTQFDNAFPITIRAARQVGKILRYLDESEFVAKQYSYYM